MALLMLLTGLVLLAAGVILLVLEEAVGRREGGREFRGGFVVVVGPIPIVVGSDEETGKTLVILAIALSLVALALFLVPLILG